MKLWPGAPYPLGRNLRRNGSELLRILRRGRACAALHLRRGRPPKPAPTSPRSTPSAGTAIFPTAARDCATASGSTDRSTPAAGLRCNSSKLLLDPYAKAIEGEVEWERGGLQLPLRRPGRRTERAGQRPVRPQVGGHQPLLRLGQRPPAPDRPGQDGHLRGARQGLHPAVTRTSRRSCGEPTPE